MKWQGVPIGLAVAALALALGPTVEAAPSPADPVRSAAEGRSDYELARQALALLDAWPVYRFGTSPEAEAWLAAVIDEQAAERYEFHRSTLERERRNLGIDAETPFADLSPDELAFLEEATGGLLERLRKVYEPVLAAADESLKARLAALYPAPDKVVDREDLTRRWLRRRVLEYVRLHELDRFPPLQAEALRAEVEAIHRLGPRAVGHPGHRPARARVLDRFRRAGLAGVQLDRFTRAAPIDEGATIYLRPPDGEPERLFSVWPNQAVPPMLPEGGIEGPLVDMGSGRLLEADGLELQGAIVLLDFNSRANWQWAAMLGARAAIFCHQEGMSRQEAAGKFINLPVDFPRYYAEASLVPRLRRMAGRGDPVRLVGRMDWQDVACGNVLGFLPSTAVTEAHAALKQELAEVADAVPPDLAEALKAGKGTEAALFLESPVAEWPEPVVRWALKRWLRADEDGYAERVARQVRRLVPGREAVLINAPLDSLSAVPGAPHGADQSGSLVALEALADYMVALSPLPRERSVVFVAFDSQFQSMYGARSLCRAIRFGEQHFRDRAAELEDDLERVKRIQAILESPGEWEFGTASGAENALLREAKDRMNFRRADVAAQRKGAETDRLPVERAALDVRLGFYKAASGLDSLGDVLQVLALVEAPSGRSPDREAVLAPLGKAAGRPTLERLLADLDEADSPEAFEALPPDTLAAVRAAMGGDDITLSWLRRSYEGRLARYRDRLDGAREDADLARQLDGLTDSETALQLAGKATGPSPEPGALEKAETRLVGLVREERYRTDVAFSIDLASHTTQITLGEGSKAVPMQGLPGDFTFTTRTNISQQYTQAGRLMNRVLDLAHGQLFANTASMETRRQYTEADGTSPEGPLLMAEITPYAFKSCEEPKYAWNTPADVPSAMDFEGLAVQAKTVSALICDALSDEALIVKAKRIRSRYTEIHGRVVKFDIRAGPFPNMPVDGALVYLVRGGQMDEGGKGARKCGGVFSHLAVLADPDGRYRLPFEPRGQGRGRPKVWAFGFDRRRGVVDLAIDEGESQTVRLTNRLRLDDSTERLDLLVFDCAGAVLFNPVDPRYLRVLKSVRILDGKSKSQPRHYTSLASDETKGKEGSADEAANCAVVFVPPNLHLQVMMGEQNLGTRRLVLLGTSADDPTGGGYPIGRGRLLEHTPLKVAEDMTRLNRDRLRRLGNAGIRSTELDELVDQADEHIGRAKRAREGRQHADAVRFANSAWGFAARAYPEVTATANDAVYGVVFFLALILPFAYFMERLTFVFKTAVYRVIGMSIWFAIVFGILFWVHPAFEISLTPLVILLAFLLLVLASVVLVLVSARFGEQVKKWRQQASGVHSADVSRLSTTAVAFNLGIANLGKRKSRTVLTIGTLILLAFSVISFTSVQQAADHYPIELGADAPYNGLMFRIPHWKDMPESVSTALEVEFAGRHLLVKRGWRMETEGGWNQWLEGSNEMALVRQDNPDARATVHCLAGFEAAEKELTGLDRCVVAGRWMREGERDVLLVPEGAAHELQLDPEDVEAGRVRIILGGRELRLIGVFRARRTAAQKEAGEMPIGADEVRGLNGESIAPIDYLASGSEGGKIGSGGAGVQGVDIEAEVGLERAFEHMSFTDVAIAPLDTIRQMSDSHVKAVCVKFAPGSPEDHKQIIDELMSRLAVNVYAGVDGRRYLIRSVGLKTIRPDWTLVAPIVLAVLIILNTMLGTVEERKGEIRMLGAVGLAPRHVAMLFFTEASVYANAGVVVGYLVGQVMAKMVVSMGWFEELSLNYSSLAAIFTAALVALIVLAATVYPARKAAALATPSGAARWAMPEPRQGRRLVLELPFTLTRGNAVGMAMFLHEYFEGHADPTSPDFSTSGLRTRAWASDGQALLALQMRVFPAPYDLGVSQRCLVTVYPTDREGVYGVRFSLRRLSSDEGSWMRTNFRFMDLIRKQFLIWRTIRLEQRRTYIEEGLQLFQ